MRKSLNKGCKYTCYKISSNARTGSLIDAILNYNLEVIATNIATNIGIKSGGESGGESGGGTGGGIDLWNIYF